MQADADGTAVIGLLVRVGSFDAALDLAAEGPETSRTEWLSTVLLEMAGRQPEAAVEIATALIEQGFDGKVFEQIMHNWARAAPAAAADFALSLPPGQARGQALITSVNAWLKSDPVAVVNWLPSVHEPREADAIRAALVIGTDQVLRPMETALAWADQISDSALRIKTIEHVMHEWIAHDRTAARAYLGSGASRLTSEQQTQLIAQMNSSAPDEQDMPL